MKTPEISQYQGSEVPFASEFARTELDRKAVALIDNGIAIGRPLLMPPDVPKERVDAFRRAFDAAMADPQFVIDARVQQMDLAPISGGRLAAMAAEIVTAPADVIKHADRLMQ